MHPPNEFRRTDHRFLPVLLAPALVLLSMPALAQTRDVAFDSGWRFLQGEAASADQPDFDDEDWQAVDLPHDWSITGPISLDNPSGHAGGWFPAGVGWYRKSFAAPAEWKGQSVSIQFDGSYANTTVWLNGEKLGSHVSGFSPFAFDLTPHLKLGSENTLAVQVDNSGQPTARWYVGSGLYRHVRLAVRGPVHLARFGTFLTTPEVNEAEATVELALELENDGDAAATFQCTTEIFELGPEGKPSGAAVATFEPAGGQFASPDEQPERSADVTSRASLPAPKLWSPDAPHLYVAVTTVACDGEQVDRRETVFGVRTIEASVEKGFLLNGKPILLYGACVHDDNGPLGAAAFDRADERRAQLLKQAGFNAVRCAHNMPSTAFLDACDRLGLLVVDEVFDTWSSPKNPHDFGIHFGELWQDELDAMVLRDRNHPSIIMWSLGNEVLDLRTERSRQIAKDLHRRTKELDGTRFTTTAAVGWGVPDEMWDAMQPALSQFDVVGYNYVPHRYEPDHQRFGDRVIFGSESFPREVFQNFDVCDRLAYVLGDFVWTGIDYLGESGIGRYHPVNEEPWFHLDNRHFPYHAAYCGDIDFTGFRKPISHARNIIWGRGETLYTAVVELTADGLPHHTNAWGVIPSKASWTWPEQKGRTLTVEVHSRHDSVRLYLNDELIGEKPTTRTEQFRATFDVPYQPGNLRTVGISDGKESESTELSTCGPVAHLRLTPERAEITADGQDLAYVVVESIDEDGNVQPNGDQLIEFDASGPGSIVGVVSGDYGLQPEYGSNERRLFNGRAMVILRAGEKPGTVTLRASSEGLPEVSTEVTLRQDGA